jgi:hypothetical protein
MTKLTVEWYPRVIGSANLPEGRKGSQGVYMMKIWMAYIWNLYEIFMPSPGANPDGSGAGNNKR